MSFNSKWNQGVCAMDEMNEDIQELISTLRVIEETEAAHPSDLALSPETILHVSNDECVVHTAESEKFLRRFGFADDKLGALVLLLDIASYLAWKTLLSPDGRLIPNTVKALKKAGYTVVSTSAPGSSAKNYVAVVTKVGTIVAHVDFQSVPALGAFKWRIEVKKLEPFSLRKFLKSLFK